MEPSTRRIAIADASVAVAARGGARALTHRAVDHEAGLPLGSTSYYARSRRDLLRLTVDRIADTTGADLGELAIPERLDVAAAADLANGFLQHLSLRPQVHRARVALLLELPDEQDRAGLTAAAPVRARLVTTAVALLTALDVDDPARHSADLVGLIDGLLLYGSLEIAAVDTRAVLESYLRGLPRTPARSGR